MGEPGKSGDVDGMIKCAEMVAANKRHEERFCNRPIGKICPNKIPSGQNLVYIYNETKFPAYLKLCEECWFSLNSSGQGKPYWHQMQNWPKIQSFDGTGATIYNLIRPMEKKSRTERRRLFRAETAAGH